MVLIPILVCLMFENKHNKICTLNEQINNVQPRPTQLVYNSYVITIFFKQPNNHTSLFRIRIGLNLFGLLLLKNRFLTIIKITLKTMRLFRYRVSPLENYVCYLST